MTAVVLQLLLARLEKRRDVVFHPNLVASLRLLQIPDNESQNPLINTPTQGF